MHITSTFYGSKRTVREKALLNQRAKEEIAKHSNVAENDIKKGELLARNQLNDVKSARVSCVTRVGKKLALNVLVNNQQLVDKCVSNLIALLVLTGGSQRAQAYAKLQWRRGADMDSLFQKSYSQEDTIGIKPCYEKSARSLEIPDFNFPSTLVPFSKFHLKIKRPIIASKSSTIRLLTGQNIILFN